MAEAAASSTQKEFKWGDEEDDDFLAGEEETRFETAPDAKGVKTITDIQIRDGKKFKITKKVRVVKKTVKINKRAEERLKKWERFGKAKENTFDITCKEQDQPFDITGQKRPAHSMVEKKIDEEINKMMRQSANKAIGVDDTEKYIPKSLRAGGRGAEAPKAAAAAEPTNTYKPPSMRDGSGGGGRTMGGGRDDTGNTVRVTNLSEDITEQDLRDLFNPYGQLLRVFLAKDRTTGESKGFAFINFSRREDAQKAIDKVSGFGHNHLILQVEWARPAGSA